MSHYWVGCDAHKHYSQFAVLDEDGQLRHQARVDHAPGAIQAFLESLPEGTPVALESVGNWYSRKDTPAHVCLPEGHRDGVRHSAGRAHTCPGGRCQGVLGRDGVDRRRDLSRWLLASPDAPRQGQGHDPAAYHKTREEGRGMMGNVNKTDKLDAKGLAKLLHLNSLPTVWLPPGEIRDERELHRTRMALSKLRTALKNRIHATLAKYGITTTEHTDIFVGAGRAWLETALSRLPPETGRCVAQELEALDGLQLQIAQLEHRIRERVALTPSIQLLKTLPGIGDTAKRSHRDRARDRLHRPLRHPRPARQLCRRRPYRPRQRRKDPLRPYAKAIQPVSEVGLSRSIP
jgi:hypothetical protein